MKQMLKRRIAIVLSLLFVLPNVLGLLPMAQLQAEAARIEKLSWNVCSQETVQVEEGQGFYVGDYATTYSAGKIYQSYTASMLKAAYKSSNTAVATVTSKGYMQTLSPGVTTITITYKGQSISKKFEIVSKGAFGELEAVTKLTNAAAKIPQQLPNNITTKNGYKYLQVLSEYMLVEEEVNETIGQEGFLKEEIMLGSYKHFQYTNKLAVPNAGRKRTLDYLLTNFEMKNSPTSTRSAKVLKLSSASASAKSSSITLNLSQKVTKEQILAARIYMEKYYKGLWPKDNLTRKQAYVRVVVYDKKKSCEGIALITQGKKKATMHIYNYKLQEDKYVIKKAKLKKGRTYQIGHKTHDWAKGKKVKAK